jgi:hypothetical protein
MGILEPGRKRRATRPSLTLMLWLVAAGLVVGLAVQALVR